MFLSQNVGYTVLFATAAVVAVVGLLFIVSLKVPEIVRKAKSSAAADGDAAGGAGGFISKIIEPSAVSIGLMCGVLFFCYSSLLTFLTPFAEENDLTTASSFFFVAYAAATFVTRPFTGKQFDRKGDRVVMVPAFIAFTIGMALLSNVHHPAAMLVAAALMGYGAGTVQSSALALAVRMAPPEKLSLANSTFYALLDVGVGVGPLILGIPRPVPLDGGAVGGGVRAVPVHRPQKRNDAQTARAERVIRFSVGFQSGQSRRICSTMEEQASDAERIDRAIRAGSAGSPFGEREGSYVVYEGIGGLRRIRRIEKRR